MILYKRNDWNLGKIHKIDKSQRDADKSRMIKKDWFPALEI